jgi:hypothetical protein
MGEECRTFKNRTSMKKFVSFIMICLYVLGTIGGLGWVLYSEGYVIAVGVVAVAFMAFPSAKKYFNDLTE